MIAVCFAICALFGASAAVEVSTSLGDIRGVTLKSRLGDDFHAFRGIRYANPPVGSLRFKSPQPVSPWKPKVLDATEDGPICPQTPFNSSDYSEDCLRLNVYTKSLNQRALKPVIIYIHPGGYYAGSGKYKDFSGPQFMMDRDIVFVSINYRLGTLGFLATGTADAPGNAGLKDQVVAFKWVRDHIIKFGGDPNSVTLFGSSSGGFSVGLHLASPMSKGLFHRGIVMSSSPVYQLPYTTDLLELARREARLLNCPTDGVSAMVKCLRETPVDEFVRIQPVILDINIDSIPTWRQVIEKDFGQERFLVEDPNESYQAGRVQKVPLIIGMVKDEFVPFAHEISQNETLTRLLNENWETMAPICLLYEQNTPRSREASRVLRKEYLNNRQLKVGDPFDDLGQLVSDGIINFGVHRFAHLAARYMPVYYYRFSFKERFSFFYYPKDKPYGTVHLDDLMYLIYFPQTTPSFKKTDPEDKIVERMTRMWSQFAATGDPNNPRDEFIGKACWQPLDLKKENYLDIGNELVQKEGLYLDRFAIWKRLFPLDWTNKSYNHNHHHHHERHHHHHERHHHDGSEDYPEPFDGGRH